MNKKIASEVAIGIIVLVAIIFGVILFLSGKKDEANILPPDIVEKKNAETKNKEEPSGFQTGDIKSEQIFALDDFNNAKTSHFQISKIERLSIKNSELPISPWSDDNLSFQFYELDPEKCGHTCSYDVIYRHDISSGKNKIIEKNDDGWIVSPNGEKAVKIITEYSEPKSEKEIGSFYIKDLKKNEVKKIGQKNFKTGSNKDILANSYSEPEWSPDGKIIIFYDDENWDENGRGISLIASNANSLSEVKQLGKTNFREIARVDEKHFFWSPDSSKVFPLDSYCIFSITDSREIYCPDDNVSGWKWSPDSKKIIGESYGDSGIETYIFDTEKNEKKTLFVRKMTEERVSYDWHPNGNFVVFSIGKSAFTINLKDFSIGKLFYDDYSISAIKYSPDGKKIIYTIGDGYFNKDLKIAFVK